MNIYLFDVSAQWERENQLREFQALIQDGFYITSRAVFLTEANGRFLFKNRAMQMLEREYQALTIAKTTTPEIIPESDTMALASGKETIEEISYTLPSGQVRWLQTVKRHLRRADGSVYVLGECTDITDITLTRQTLERSEKQYRDLIYYSPAIIVTHDLNGVILSCNPTMANLLQVSGVEVVGKDLREFMPAEYLPQVPAYLDQIAAKQEVTGIYTIETRERQVHHLLYQSYRVDEDGRLAYVIVYAQDVTQRLRTDRELKRAKEAAEAAVQARENFLANMSHEIRTPMNGVLGMARQLAKTQLDARQQEQLEIITSSGQHLLRILNDVLDMAKITSGKLELEQSVFNLCDSMKQAVEPLIIQAVEKGIAVRSTRLHESCAGPWVSGDAYRLNQVLINLVANAVKFTPSGGSIYIEGLLLRETNTHLTTEFSVSDTGIGIAADKLESIFEDFAQGSTDTTRQYGGTGLGLSICRALVAQLDGKLSVESELGRGSKFSFVVTLPRAEPVSKIPRRAAFDTGALRGRRILVTEDNKINRSILQLLLSEWGVDVDEAEDGAVAVALACQRSYDAILMDIQMPVLSGVEATWQIRKYSKARHAKVPILALTANAFRADCERYLAAGMEDCLTKPFEEAELYQKLVVLLENRTVLCYNLTGLYKMAQGNHIFVQSIIRSFLTNMPATVNELRQAAQTAQWPKVAKLIHHIKPNLEQLRITAIRPAVEMLMQPPNEAL
ncbi:MAG TPA: ATP-binding protein, partial [Hymenobacter sp.]